MVREKLGGCGFGIGVVEGAPQDTVWGRSALEAPPDEREGWPVGFSCTEGVIPGPKGGVVVQVAVDMVCWSGK